MFRIDFLKFISPDFSVKYFRTQELAIFLQRLFIKYKYDFCFSQQNKIIGLKRNFNRISQYICVNM